MLPILDALENIEEIWNLKKKINNKQLYSRQHNHSEGEAEQ